MLKIIKSIFNQRTKPSSPSRPSSQYSAHPSPLLAEQICACIWRDTLDFSKSTDAPKHIDFDVCIWTSLFYSISDILEKSKIKEAVWDNFGSITCRLMDIPTTELSLISRIEHSRDKTFKMLSSDKTNPFSLEGIRDILDYVYLFCGDDDDGYDFSIGPDSVQISEFMIAVGSVSIFVSNLLNQQPTNLNCIRK